MTIFHCHVEEARYVVCMTTDARDHIRIPRASFPKPGEAAAYAHMRQANVQPLRAGHEGPPPPVVGPELLDGSLGSHQPSE